MTKERELLRRALDAWDRPASDKFSVIFEEVRTYLSTPSNDAEEPVKCKRCNGTGAIKTGEIDCYPDGTPYMNGPVICVEDCPDCHPPKPAESEAPELYAVVERLAKWNKDYPSTRVYGYGDIKQIAEEMEAINAQAIAALAKARGEA